MLDGERGRRRIRARVRQLPAVPDEYLRSVPDDIASVYVSSLASSQLLGNSSVHFTSFPSLAITCSLWQRSSLNPALSNPNDVSLRRMAKRRHWRRCSKCRIVVEKTEGCSHMTCRCGHQFCHLYVASPSRDGTETSRWFLTPSPLSASLSPRAYRCGSDWAYNGCTNSNPKSCDGRRWRDDPSLHVPSRWKGAIQRTGAVNALSRVPFTLHPPIDEREMVRTLMILFVIQCFRYKRRQRSWPYSASKPRLALQAD